MDYNSLHASYSSPVSKHLTAFYWQDYSLINVSLMNNDLLLASRCEECR